MAEAGNLSAATSKTEMELWAKLSLWGEPLEMSAVFGPEAIFRAKFGDSTLGDLIAKIVGWAIHEPDFKLDSPWDILNDINLSDLTLEYNFTKKKIGVEYALGKDFVFVKIDSFTIWYSFGEGKSVDFSIVGNFLGQAYPASNPLTWDMLSQSPPAVPGKGAKLFDLDYLGIGQHVTFRDTSNFSNVQDVITALQQTVQPAEDPNTTPLQAGGGLVFDSKVGWLVGTKFTVIETVTLGVVFNDPNLYGLLISLSGPRAKIFSGLSFQILYRKVTDKIGVYSIELALPTAIRHLDFGAVGITLPVIGIDIYTNGNFKVDFGFPKGLDFSQSFGIQAMAGPVPVIGAGGFYFAVLDGATSSTVPKITNGSFDPVIEFGFGLSLGVGKDLNYGVLSAGISITFVGILQGTLAWFEPDNASVDKAMYYRLQGTIAIVGRLYGTVNFVVVKASVSVVVYASAQITMESHAPIVFTLSAGVEVKVSIKIVFVRVHFSFKATITEKIQIGSQTATPWIVDQGQSNSAAPKRLMSPSAPLMLFAAGPSATSPPDSLDWAPFKVWATPSSLDVNVVASVTQGKPEDDVSPEELSASSSSSSSSSPSRPISAKVAISMFVENSIHVDAQSADECRYVHEGTEDNPFNLLAQTMLAWAIQAGLPPSPQPILERQVSAQDLQAIFDLLNRDDDPKAPKFTEKELSDFLEDNLQFTLKSTIPEAELSGTFFPMFPELALEFTASDGSSQIRRYDQWESVSSDYADWVREYFEQLEVQYKTPPQNGDGDLNAAPQTTASSSSSLATGHTVASLMFADYFLMVIRASLQSATSQLQQFPHVIAGASSSASSVDTLFSLANQYLVNGSADLDSAVEAIAATNQTDPDLLATGSRLKIAGVQYQVVASDTLASIARRFQTGAESAPTAASIAVSNQESANLLSPGGTLKIPETQYEIPTVTTTQSLSSEFQVPAENIVPDNPANRSDLSLPPLSKWFVNNDVLTSSGAPNSSSSSSGSTAQDTLRAIADELEVKNPDVTLAMLLGLNQQFNADQVLPNGTLVSIPTIRFQCTGHSLAELAYRFQISAATVAKMNGISQAQDEWENTSLDRELYLPRVIFTVPPNDGESLATYFNVSIQDLQQENPDVSFGVPIPSGTMIKLSGLTRVIQQGDSLTNLTFYYSQMPSASSSSSSSGAGPPAITVTDLANINAGTSGILAALAKIEMPSLEHVVAEGEQLATIATQYALSVSQLALANLHTDFLAAGETLTIPNVAKLTVSDLLDGLVTTGGFNGVASMVSRYMMHGVRLPAPSEITTHPDLANLVSPPETRPLFYLTGQQFDVLPGVNEDTPITLSSTQSVKWLQLPEGGLTISIDAEQKSLIEAFSSQNLELTIDSLAPIALYRLSPQQFPLKTDITWQDPTPPTAHATATTPAAGNPTIWKLPPSLLQRLQDTSPLDVTLEIGRHDKPDQPMTCTQLENYWWATAITIRVQQINPAGSKVALPNAYLLEGSDQQGRELLQLLYEFLQASGGSAAELQLLYAPSATGSAPDGLKSDQVDSSQILLIKTNLSTMTNSSVSFASARIAAPGETTSDDYASLADATEFIKLLWETSTINSGGYYLNYVTADDQQGLPGYLFGDDDYAELTLLVRMSAAQSSLQGFQNCVIVTDNLDLTNAVLFVEAAKLLQKTATIPPGNVSFSLKRQNEPPASSSSSGGHEPPEYQLQHLYNLMSYQILESGGFAASLDSTPIGPTENSDSEPQEQSDDDVWNLEHVVPVFRFVGHAPPLSSSSGSISWLPAEDDDPYVSIGLTSTLAFHFQDVFGNRTDPQIIDNRAQKSPPLTDPLSLSIESTYFDNLIPVSQWPSAHSAYTVGQPPAASPSSSADGQVAAQGELTIAWDVSKYMPSPGNELSNAQQNAFADASKFARIYYQLKQSQVELNVSTTLDDDHAKPIHDKLPFINLAGNAYGYLQVVQAIRPKQVSGAAFADSSSTTFGQLGSQYYVDPTGLADANRDVPAPFLPNALGTSATILVPRYYLTTSDQTLREVTDATQTNISPRQLVGNNASLSGMLSAGAGMIVDIVYPDPAASLEDMKQQTGVTIENIATINQLVPLQSAQTLNLGQGKPTYDVQPGDTLAGISDKFSVPISNLAAANSTLQPLFQSSDSSSASSSSAEDRVEIPIVYVIQAEDTFEKIAATTNKSLADLADLNERVPGLLVTGAQLFITTQPESVEDDTLDEIAAAATLSANNNVPDGSITITRVDIVTYNLDTPLNPAATFYIPYLVDLAELKYPAPSDFVYRVVDADTFQKIADKPTADGMTRSVADLGQANGYTTDLLQTNAPVLIPMPSYAVQQLPTSASSSSSSRAVVLTQSFGDIAALTFLSVPDARVELASLGAFNQDVSNLLIPGAMIVLPDSETHQVQTDDTLASIVSAYNKAHPSEPTSVGELVTIPVNRDNQQLLAAGALMTIPVLTKVRPNDTLATVAQRLPGVTLTALAEANASPSGQPNLLAPGKLILLPAAVVTHQFPVYKTAYEDPIFQVTTALTIQRISNIDPDFDDVAEVSTATTAIPPKTASPVNNASMTNEALLPFARELEAAMPELKLATGLKLSNRKTSGQGITRTATASAGTSPLTANDAKALWAVWIVESPATWRDSPNNQPICYSIDASQPAFFGVPPLENTPGHGKVNFLEFDGTNLTYDSKEKTLENIDMDVWGRSFLAAVDEFLTAPYAVPVVTMSEASSSSSSSSDSWRESFDRILTAKQTLADAISQKVTNILETAGAGSSSSAQSGTSPGNVSDAQDALEQRLLIELSTAYTTDAIVQYPVTVASTYDVRNTAPRLSGKPSVVTQVPSSSLGGSSKTADTTLSNAKVPLFAPSSSADGPSNAPPTMTFLFSVAHAAQHKNLALQLDYQINELEFDIGPVEGIPDYQQSSWLSFVIPISSSTMLTPDVPIPLRSYPVPPTLESQTGRLNPTSNQSDDWTNDVMNWEYAFTFQHLSAMQDTLYLNVDFNVPPSEAQTLSALGLKSSGLPAPKNLFEALAQFDHVYPQIAAVLDLLPQLAAGRDLSAQLSSIEAAVKAFSILVERVAQTWSNVDSASQAVESHYTFTYRIDEVSQTPPILSLTHLPERAANSKQPTLPYLPYIEIEGYETYPREPPPWPQTSVEYTFHAESSSSTADPSEGPFVPRRTITIRDLYMLAFQNAWGGLELARNENLVATPTNPAFVYKTPDVRFSNVMSPTIVQNATHFLPEPTSQPQCSQADPEERALCSYLQTLLDQLIRQEVTVPFHMRVACDYGYFLAQPEATLSSNAWLATEEAEEAGQGLMANLPVLLVPRSLPFETGTDDKGSQLVQALAKSIAQWQQESQPQLDGGVYAFKLAFFSDLDTNAGSSAPPLVQITNLLLPLNDLSNVVGS